MKDTIPETERLAIYNSRTDWEFSPPYLIITIAYNDGSIDKIYHFPNDDQWTPLFTRLSANKLVSIIYIAVVDLGSSHARTARNAFFGFTGIIDLDSRAKGSE